MRVLVIGSVPSVLHHVKRVLVYRGFVVETAEGGAEGLEKAYENPPDILLSEFMIASPCGLEVAQILHDDTRFADTKFILVTASSNIASEAEEMRREMVETWPWIYWTGYPGIPKLYIDAIVHVAKQVDPAEKQE